MPRVIRFLSARFDVSTERPNPINPIAGESLLLWLREQVKAEVEMSPPEAEDWGWYSFVSWQGRQYLIGSCASEEEEGGEREWILQIDKQRSMRERLLGHEKMARDDECASYFQRLLEQEASFRVVEADAEPE